MLRSVGSALLASHQQAASARAAVAVAAVHRLAPRHTTCIARAHIHSTATTHDESAAEPVAAASSDVKQVRPNIPAMVAAAGAPQRTMVRPTRSQRKARAKQNLNLREKPERSPVDLPASASLPKQKVAMYTKILRVLRSPVKGKVKTTSGDDYMLGQDETQSKNSHFTGLITANLSPPAPKRPARRAGKDTGRSYGKGGRKSARAHVWIQKAINKGTGDFYVNGLRYVEYFSELDHRWELCAPFYHTNTLTDFDMIAVVRGGGRSGQAGAIKHAAAKALQSYDRARYRPMLKKKFLLSRDARVVERKKYGQKKARKSFTFVKR